MSFITKDYVFLYFKISFFKIFQKVAVYFHSLNKLTQALKGKNLKKKLKTLYVSFEIFLDFYGALWRTDSFEKTLILGKIEGGRRKG